MNDFFSDLVAGEGPVAREVKFRGKTKTVHFRRITAGERVKLVTGQRMQMGGDQRGRMEMDLGDMARNRHLMVQFSVVTESGAQVFKNLAEVQAQPEALVDELATHAEAVNADAGDAGNA